MHLRPTFLFAAVLVTGPAFAQTYPYEGRWAHQQSSCQNRLGQVGPNDEIPIEVEARRAADPVIECAFRSVRQTGPNRWRVNAVCIGDGQRTRNTFTLSLENDRLTWPLASHRPYVRCPR